MKKPPRTNEFLRRARQERGWTQRRLARELGVEEQTVRSWELGTRFPSLEFRSRLCALFLKTPEELGLQLPQKDEQISQQPPLPTALPIDSSQLTASQVDRSQPIVLPVDPLLPLPREENGINGHAVQPWQRGSSSLVLHQTDRNRQRMLKRMRALWISGVLEHSLYRATLIMLGLQEQPDAVENPWQLAMQEADLPPRPLPAGTRITQVYDEADGQLLILGEPGAGKTTLLLELARDLLDRAEDDQSHPIPVIFDLSSWAVKQHSLAEWVAEELESKYWVPRKIGQEWIDTNQLLLLLDGLDEVAETARSACVKALNAYQQTHEFGPFVVCCRKEEYEAVSTRVILQQAVVVQPLTPEQIDAYLSHTGGQLEAVRRELNEDSQMREMVTTPLMLNIVTLVYQGKANAPFPIASLLVMRRERVLAMYVKRMLARRATKTRYTEEQMVHWLAWLAYQLVHHNQTEFHPQWLQPDWLPDGWFRRFYRHAVTWLFYGIIFSVNAVVFAWLRGKTPGGFGGNFAKGILRWLSGGSFGPRNEILGWMAPGLGGGLSGGTTAAIVSATVSLVILVALCRSDTSGTERTQAQFLQAIISGVRNGIVTGEIGGLVGGLLCQVLLGWADGLISGLGYGAVGGLLVGLVSGIASALEGRQMHLIAAPSPRSTFVRRIWLFVHRLFLLQWADRLIIGLLAGLSFGFVSSWLIGVKSGMVSGLVDGVMTFLILGLGVIPGFGGRRGGGLVAGLGVEIRPVKIVLWSWRSMVQGLVRNVKDGAPLGFATMGSLVMCFVLMSGRLYGIQHAVAFGLTFGLIGGLTAGLTILLFGGLEGWSTTLLDEQTFVHPGQGIRRALFHGLLAGIIGGISSGLISGFVSDCIFLLVGRLSSALALGTAYGLVFGVIFAVLFWLAGGGRTWMEHSLLRFLLWCAGCAPLDYPAFLDSSVERILLRRKGGRYIFVHRLLLDYFASLYTTNKTSSSRKNSRSA